jgi:allantoicase
MSIDKLKKRLAKVESELDKCRTTVMQDGWQTQRHANKSRKWDFYAQEKMRLIQKIEEIENERSN